MRREVLVLAAVPEELGELEGSAVGIGPVRAAVGAARCLSGSVGAGCVLVGSAGAYPGGPPVGSVVVARWIGLSGGVADAGLGYVPQAPEPLETDRALRERLTLVEADVLTVEAIATDPDLAEHRGTRWQVEHMEAYAVALAAQAAGVPFVAVLGISNVVGPHAHAQWKAHRGAAEASARAAVQVLLR